MCVFRSEESAYTSLSHGCNLFFYFDLKVQNTDGKFCNITNVGLDFWLILLLQSEGVMSSLPIEELYFSYIAVLVSDYFDKNLDFSFGRPFPSLLIASLLWAVFPCFNENLRNWRFEHVSNSRLLWYLY